MHTTDRLTADVFEYHRGHVTVPRREVMPSIAVDDRLGVVMATPTDGLGAANFVLSCVTAFYDELRERREEFFEYPDYYTFQASPDPLDYLEFDVWPNHKNVSVTADPERILRAVNDRAVDVLLVPDALATEPDLEDVTLRSAERRIDACYLYAPDGELEGADFSIRLPRETVEEWYRETLDVADADPSTFAPVWFEGKYLEQQFHEVGLETALTRLPTGDGP